MDDDGPIMASGEITIPSGILPKLQNWYNEVLIAQGNIKTKLYEDDIMTISVSSEYRIHQGRLTLIIYNKTGAEITNFKVTLPVINILNIRMQEATNRIFPNDEIKILLAVEALRPFDESPEFIINFTIGQAPYKYALKLPVTQTSLLVKD